MTVRVLIGDARERLAELPDESVHCCVTSPPYFGLRDYGVAGQIGLEKAPDDYVAELVAVFREVRRVLRDDGTLFLNLGDSYANDGKWGGSTSGKHVSGLRGKTGIGRSKVTTGLKPKDLIGIPWLVAFALRADGWYLRSDIIWAKPNPMPESVTDRPTSAHEHIFLLSKSQRYFYDADAVREAWADNRCGANGARPGTPEAHAKKAGRGGDQGLASFNAKKSNKQDALGKATYTGFNARYADNPVEGRNRRNVWTIATHPYPEAHFATFPPALVEPCIKAGCPKGGTVLDPFGGSGTTGLVADRLQRNAVLIEINPEYAAMAEARIYGDAPMFSSVGISAP